MIVMSSKKLFTRCTVIGEDTKASFEEQESFGKLKQRISFGVLDYRPKEMVVLVCFLDAVEDGTVEFHSREGAGGKVIWGSNVGIMREGISSRVSDTRDMVDVSIKPRQDFVPPNLPGREILLHLPVC